MQHFWLAHNLSVILNDKNNEDNFESQNVASEKLRNEVLEATTSFADKFNANSFK